MPNIKLSELPNVGVLPANTQQLTFIVTDSSGLFPVSRQVQLSQVDNYFDNNTTRNQANSAYEKANVVGVYANASFSYANTVSQNTIIVGVYANSAFDQSNTATSDAATADQRAVTSGSYANGAYSKSNTATQYAESAGDYANAAFNIANSAVSLANSSNSNSMIIITTAPATPKGNTGDEVGMVYMTNVALYYCTSNYDGNTNIWSKITSTDTW